MKLMTLYYLLSSVAILAGSIAVFRTTKKNRQYEESKKENTVIGVSGTTVAEAANPVTTSTVVKFSFHCMRCGSILVSKDNISFHINKRIRASAVCPYCGKNVSKFLSLDQYKEVITPRF